MSLRTHRLSNKLSHIHTYRCIYPQQARVWLSLQENKKRNKDRERERSHSIHWAHFRELNNCCAWIERWEGDTVMSWFPLSNHWNKHPPRVCVCQRDFMWVCMRIYFSLDVHMSPAETIKVIRRRREVCTERGRRLVLLNDPAPTVWPWGPCVYYLMTLCPEWETDPLWVRLRRKEVQFQCILHSNLSAQHTALEVSPQSPRPLRTTKCLTCRLETCTVCMCFVLVCALRDKKKGKQWQCMFPRTLFHLRTGNTSNS